MEDVSFTYPGAAAPVLQHVSLSIEPMTRLGLLGRNGAGKSTLVGLLMQTLMPTRGEVTHRRQATVRLFNQHHADSLAPDSCPLRHMMQLFPEEKEQVLRNHLGSFGIAGGLAVLDNAELSGGQKTRVALAALTFARPHILVLDEPTNHLDFESVQALQQALADFEGGLVLVSHDRHFMAECARDLYLVERGMVERFDGTVADYAAAVEAEAGVLEP
jgi:ATP-binding cassette subfamily F protein 3